MPEFFTRAERAHLAKNGEAMPDGRYPIRNARDLENAHKDWIRTGRNPDVAKWISQRAHALGATNPINGTAPAPAAASSPSAGGGTYDERFARVLAKHGFKS